MDTNKKEEQVDQSKTTAQAAGTLDVSSLGSFADHAQETDPRDAEIAQLKHRLEVESAEQGRLRKTNEELKKIQEENARLKAEVASLSSRKPDDFLSPEEREELDPKQLAVIDKLVKGRMGDISAAQEAERRRIQEELERRDAYIAANSRTQFNAEVERLAPGLAALVTENREAWQKWAASPRRAASVAQAFNRYDAATVAEFFNEFVQSKGIRANGDGVAARPQSSYSPRGGNRPVQDGNDTTTYTLEQFNAEMRKASEDVNAGRITPDEYRAIKRKFDVALAENRVVTR